MTSKRKDHSKGAEVRPDAEQQVPGEAPTQPQAAEVAGAPGEAPAAPVDVETLRCERDDLLARLQRVSADYLNYQKRVQRDIETTREYANEQLIKALLGVLDDMERALEAARKNHDAQDALLAGMQLVHDKAMETLGKFGLSAIEAEGKPFDPDVHAAMLQQPSAVHPPRTVLKELLRGYRLKGRTIRPSGVVVSTGPEAPQAAPPGEEAEPEDVS